MASKNFDSLLQMSKENLKDIAKSLNLTGYSSISRKNELVDFILMNTNPKTLKPYIDEWSKEMDQTNAMGAMLDKYLKDEEINKQINDYNSQLLQQNFEQFGINSNPNRKRKSTSPYARRPTKRLQNDIINRLNDLNL